MNTRFLLAVIAGLALAFTAGARAQDLNADETRTVLSASPWKVQAGATYNYFIWNSDGTLCVKIFDPHAANCDDTGNWSRDETEVCYELEWWGQAYEQNRGCFRIAKGETGGYAAINAAGLPELSFYVLDSE